MFAPIDVSDPDMRRKQLVSKLMQQAGAHAAAPSMLPPAASTLGLAEGLPFRDAHQSLAAPQSTQSMNIAANVLSKLGSMGYGPAPNEYSPTSGSAVPNPTAAYANLYATTHNTDAGTLRGAGQQTNLTPGLATPLTPASGSIVGPSSDLVPLGGGLMYDPSTDSVVYPNGSTGVGAGTITAGAVGPAQPPVPGIGRSV